MQEKINHLIEQVLLAKATCHSLKVNAGIKDLSIVINLDHRFYVELKRYLYSNQSSFFSFFSASFIFGDTRQTEEIHGYKVNRLNLDEKDIEILITYDLRIQTK